MEDDEDDDGAVEDDEDDDAAVEDEDDADDDGAVEDDDDDWVNDDDHEDEVEGTGVDGGDGDGDVHGSSSSNHDSASTATPLLLCISSNSVVKLSTLSTISMNGSHELTVKLFISTSTMFSRRHCDRVLLILLMTPSTEISMNANMTTDERRQIMVS
jgi:hypothetical protein